MKKTILLILVFFHFFVVRAEENLTIKYEKPTTEWVKEVKISFDFNSINELKSYALNGDLVEISGNEYQFVHIFDSNGIYELEIKDTADNTASEIITIENIDSNPPTIKKLEIINNNKYVSIVVEALDNESGLANEPFSFDLGKTWLSKNTYDVFSSKEYQILVKDKVGNVYSKIEKIEVPNEVLPKINNFIFGEYVGEYRNVLITFLNCSECKVLIKDSKSSPVLEDEWHNIDNNGYSSELKEGEYIIWLKDANDDIVDQKSFKVSGENNVLKNKSLLLIISLLIVFVLTLKLINRKNNRV